MRWGIFVVVILLVLHLVLGSGRPKNYKCVLQSQCGEQLFIVYIILAQSVMNSCFGFIPTAISRQYLRLHSGLGRVDRTLQTGMRTCDIFIHSVKLIKFF